MECFSSTQFLKLSLVFENIISSQSVSKRELYNSSITAYVEGDLRICVNDKLFFEQEGILLVELYVQFKEWICAKNKFLKDFSYQSMDFEEKHVLEFIEREDGTWYIHSEWENFNAQDSRFSLLDLEQAIELFFISLEKEIQRTFSLNIKDLV